MARAAERLALIELLERDGRVLRQHDVHEWPLTIGRALDCDLVLDDAHVAPRHARLEADEDGAVWLVAGESVNGVLAGRRTLRRGERVALGALGEPWRVGMTRLRVRLAGEPVAPEQPMHRLEAVDGRMATALLSLAWWAVLMAQHWLSLDPDHKLSDWLGVLLTVPALVVAWCGAWGLASKLFRHRVDFAGHWRLAVRAGLALSLVSLLLPRLAAALGSPALFRIVDPVLIGGGVLWLYGHCRRVLPQHARALGVIVGVAMLVSAGVTVALRAQREAPLLGPLYMSALPQAGLRVARPASPEAFADAANGLRGLVDERARADREPADGPGDDEE